MKSSASPEALKKTVLEQVEACRRQLEKGQGVDASGIMRGVEKYCAAIAALPRAEGRRHTQDLQALMQTMTELSSELVAAHNSVRGELEALGRLRKANDAYQKSDAIGGKRKKKESES